VIDFKSYFSLHLIKSVREILIKREIKNIIFLGASEMRSLYFATLGLDINFIIRQGSKKTTKKKDFLHKLFYSNVDHFVGNCEYIKQNIIDILPIPQKASVSRIYSSLKIDENIQQHQFDGLLKIVLVGRVHPFKGQLETIKTCEVLFDNNIEFSVKFLGDIQDENYYNEIQTYLKECRYKDKIEFVGYTNKVKEYLLGSDVFMFPSLGEGMSNAIIEALGYGLIPIIYDDTSSPEFKDLGFHIYLTDKNSVECLKEKLLIVSQNIVDEKVKAGLNIKLAQEVFSIDRERDEYLGLLSGNRLCVK
jgi:glycosyltransferase involved in cell wall biosynthesis